ncbi:MAG TPA: SGNH/GDSL hydrolase family protein [Anaerolineaceae bacterium]|nr:SGNH/GDSL hydrolase family protein [Anaerolineaceae bacterium]
MNNQKWVYILAVIFMLIVIPVTAYLFIEYQQAEKTPTAQAPSTNNPIQTSATQVASSNNQLQAPTIAPTDLVLGSPIATATPGKMIEPMIIQNPPAESWKEWPVLPNYVSEDLREIYKKGIEDGNNPHAFSIFGDCHSLPEIFLGEFDNDPDFVKTFDPSIQETVANFQGSFDRYSPTVKIGTTEGALLWPLWNDNEEGKCEPNENAVDCELRVHKPSIVIIQVGTHYESRNEQYMIRILEKLLDNGIIPIIVTKADNRELDERINETLVRLAAQYDIPLWNFWASVQHLVTQGIDPDDDMYLTDDAYTIHQEDGIKVLDFVWHTLNSEN